MCQIVEQDPGNHTVESLTPILLDEDVPIAKRTRAAFLLRQIGTNEAIDVISRGLKSESILLGHELAFILGQLQNSHAIPKLVEVIKSNEYHAIVRHEAAEAIGAIGDIAYLPLLEAYENDACIELAETCQVAIGRLRWLADHPNWDNEYKSLYDSIDPAPAHESDDIDELSGIFLDTSRPLFDRYRAMMKLRDINSKASVDVLAKGFADTSALYKHEIAFVFGQMMNKHSSSALLKVLHDLDEHPVVRHEAAEALGSLIEDDDESTKQDEGYIDIRAVLEHFKNDSERIVRESCEVALDIFEYWNSDEIETAFTNQDAEETVATA